MKILRNYILRELCYPIFISVVTLTFIFLVGNVVKIADLLLNRGVDFFELMKFLALIIPQMLIFTLPTSVLTSILLVFGDFAEHNEIIAIRAHGVNPFKVMMPVIVIGLLLSIFVLILSDQIVPRYSFLSRKTLKSLFIKDPFAYIKPGIPAELDNGYVFLAREVGQNELKNVTVYQPQEGKPTRTILAERCEVVRLEHESKIKVRLYNGTIDEPDEEDTKVFNKLDFSIYELPLLDLENINLIGKKTKEYSIDELVQKLRSSGLSEAKRREYVIEIHKKISFSFGCLVFTILGLPIAIITRRGNMLISFGLALMVLTIYYVFYSWAQAVSLQGLVAPHIALWTPFVLMSAIGSVLMYKVIRV
ncbi:MAG: LptF/LptG family permease [Candidatus Omnitrophica bacterium]|nr:LptF/LptG family permease [Candidatus Omnitrophota bacterium]